MRVLLTDSRGSLGTALVKWLAQHHEVRTLDPAADLRDRDTASRSVQDCDMIIHSMTTVLPGMAPLDALDTASRATFNLITQAASASRFILLSSLRILEQYDVKWHVTEAWAPKPTTAVDNLAPYLAELTVREASRVLPIRAIALRLGDVVEDADMKDCPASSRWLHINDAVQAVERALGFEPTPRDPRTGWWVFHIPGGGPRTRFPLAEAGEQPFNYAPRHDVTSSVPLPLTPSPTYCLAIQAEARREGRAAARPDFGRRRASRRQRRRGHGPRPRPATCRRTGPGRHYRREWSALPGAPMPRLLEAPHEMRIVDLTDYDQVTAAAEGMDAIVNCSVVRGDPVDAFRVNMLGAYNIMRAAVEQGIRRVVHTGPRGVHSASSAGFKHDFDLVDDVPTRPGTHLYFMTKYLGEEVCRIFAEEYDLQAPALLYSHHVNPDSSLSVPPGEYGLTVSYRDSGAALRLAVDVPSFPRPFELLQVTTDLPNGRYRNEKAKRLLSWQPHDQLEERWRRHVD